MYKDDLLNDEDLKELADNYIENKLRTTLLIDKGSIFPVPCKKSERLYISAPSGSGKSTFIGNYLEQIRMEDAKRKIVIFSRVEHDEPLDKFKKTLRIPLEAEFWDAVPMKPEEFKKNQFVFLMILIRLWIKHY